VKFLEFFTNLIGALLHERQHKCQQRAKLEILHINMTVTENLISYLHHMKFLQDWYGSKKIQEMIQTWCLNQSKEMHFVSHVTSGLTFN
jgi:hypothetical protein